MTADPLLDELTASLGSRREAAWVLEELEHTGVTDRRGRGLELAARRRAGEPLQYLLGHWPFRSLDLLVDPRALIPRPETEQLVGLALEELARGQGPRVVCDLGCGTGAIALCLAVEGTAAGLALDVHATDVDDDALDLARVNAARSAAVVEFHRGSWYDALPHSLEGRVHLICSNPPYVSALERPGLGRELDFEPELALVARDGTEGTPGFGTVEEVVVGAARWLVPGGVLLVEHGEAQRAAALACAQRSGLVEGVDLDDLAGRPRVLRAVRPT